MSAPDRRIEILEFKVAALIRELGALERVVVALREKVEPEDDDRSEKET